jgi:hypothetical protein
MVGIKLERQEINSKLRLGFGQYRETGKPKHQSKELKH